MFRNMVAAFALIVAMPAAAQAPAYVSHVDAFDRFATETASMPPEERVRKFREKFNALVPGFYTPRRSDDAKYNARVQKALGGYPAERDKILAAARAFEAAYVSGNARFLRFFPDYKPTMPIFLLHSLGEMDGGTRQIQGRTVAVFGADVIAQIHGADTIGPFLDHELFHFHHASYFPECEKVWCALWAEGLATYVAGRMNPGADDRALMLTFPRPIRPELEPRLDAAMCYAKANLDTVDQTVYGTLFFGNGVSEFPPRFGYLLGYLIAQKIGEGMSLDALAKMGMAEVRPKLDQVLADYSCPPAA